MVSSRPDNFQKEHNFREGPLAAYAQQFRAHLEAQQYRKVTIYQYLVCVDAFSQLLRQREIDIGDVDENQVARLLENAEEPSLRGKFPVFIIKSCIRFLCSIGVAKPLPAPAPDDTVRGRLRAEWEQYLRRQRGVSERTIKHSWWLISRFLKFCFGEEKDSLPEVKAAHIARFMQQAALRSQPLRNKTSPTHLRNFCLFLFQTNRTATNLAPSILGVTHRYQARLPRHLTAEQVEAILTAVKEDTPLGRRNYAMVLLLARLGLRAEEVVAIQLEDLDWRAGELVVRGKGKRHDRLPMPIDVGEAITEYIRRDRLTSTRSLFVTERPPRVGFTNGQILNTVLKDAFAKTGLKRPLPWVGAHVLRHSLAVSLVQQGSSIEEIADLLRHRCKATTLLYTRLDIEGLRSLALPWPGKENAK
jgi:site-specific recombinase XerD